jgi:hypothetical protein
VSKRDRPFRSSFLVESGRTAPDFELAVEPTFDASRAAPLANGPASSTLSLADRTDVYIDVARLAFPSFGWWSAFPVESGSRLEPGLSHELRPVTSVGPAVSAVLLEDHDVGQLVAKGFFKNVPRAVDEARRQSDQPALGIAAAQAASHAGAELGADLVLEACDSPQGEPFLRPPDGPVGQSGVRILHGSIRGEYIPSSRFPCRPT